MNGLDVQCCKSEAAKCFKVKYAHISLYLFGSVTYPHSFRADPSPALYFNADPDPVSSNYRKFVFLKALSIRKVRKPKKVFTLNLYFKSRMLFLKRKYRVY